jgi:hypothetical protein
MSFKAIKNISMATRQNKRMRRVGEIYMKSLKRSIECSKKASKVRTVGTFLKF